MNVQTAAKRLQVSERTIRAMCRNGALKATKTNKTAPWDIKIDDSFHCVSVKAIAEVMNYSPVYIRSLIKKRCLSSTKVGREHRINTREFINLLKIRQSIQ